MKKISKLSLNIGLFLALIIFLIPQVRANPVPIVYLYHPLPMALYLIFLFIATFSIELLVIKVFLGANKPLFDTRYFYKTVFAVNIFTFTLTQIVAFVIYQYLFVGYEFYSALFVSILIEVFPITLEGLLFLKIFNALSETGYFQHRIKNNTILKFTITANLVSFAFGILTYSVIPV
ncbi:MAG: hypothetical protein ACFE9S_00010 [Candidatus Hermodarchaeota archaeon]